MSHLAFKTCAPAIDFPPQLRSPVEVEIASASEPLLLPTSQSLTSNQHPPPQPLPESLVKQNGLGPRGIPCHLCSLILSTSVLNH